MLFRNRCTKRSQASLSTRNIGVFTSSHPLGWLRVAPSYAGTRGGEVARITKTISGSPDRSKVRAGKVSLTRRLLVGGVCPSIGADRVMGAVGSDTRRRARSRCHPTSSVRNKVDGLWLSQLCHLSRLGNKRPPITRREQVGCDRFRWLDLLDPAGCTTKSLCRKP